MYCIGIWLCFDLYIGVVYMLLNLETTVIRTGESRDWQAKPLIR